MTVIVVYFRLRNFVSYGEYMLFHCTVRMLISAAVKDLPLGISVMTYIL